MKNKEIEYPCTWSYKIIGSDRELIWKNIETALEDLEYELNNSHQSKTGKYASLHLSIQVDSQEERDRLFQMLQNIPTVKMVI